MRLALFAATAALVLIAAAPPARDQLLGVMHERHEGMEAIGDATKALRRELTGGSPNGATVRSSAAKMAGLSQRASGWFPKGSGPELGKTGAKSEIWQNSQDFSARLRDFQAAARALNVAAASGDMNATKARFADLGGTCKSCHDKYRAEMHH